VALSMANAPVPEEMRGVLFEGARAGLTDLQAREAVLAALEPAERVAAAAYFGDADRLFEEPDLMTRDGLFSLVMSAWLPSLAWLREDPRFYAAMQAVGFADYWAEHGYPLDCRLADTPAGPGLRCGR
jgi:hypothetical protein